MGDAATTEEADLVMIPLRMALWKRGREGHPAVAGELIHHSDAGSQGGFNRWSQHLALEEILPSIRSVGDAYDALYKAECIRTTVFREGPYRTIIDVEFATAGWVDWSNNRRLHSSRGNVPPVEFDQAHDATLNREPHPAWKRHKTWGASLLVTRVRSGTRVSTTVSAIPRDVLNAATQLAAASKSSAVDLDEAIRVLRAIWHE